MRYSENHHVQIPHIGHVAELDAVFLVSFPRVHAASAFILLLRAESIIYFKYNLVLYLYSLIAAAFLITR